MAISYVLSDSIVMPQLGILLVLLGVEIYLIYHEEEIRALKRQHASTQ